MKTTGKSSDQLHKEWLKNPAYVEAYQEMEPEFAMASALIEARSTAGLSQGDIAKRMNTTQSAIARLESGSQNTSLKTLQRYAQATGTQLKISFESPMVQRP